MHFRAPTPTLTPFPSASLLLGWCVLSAGAVEESAQGEDEYTRILKTSLCKDPLWLGWSAREDAAWRNGELKQGVRRGMDGIELGYHCLA